MRSVGPAPSASDIEAIARRALEQLPEPFASQVVDVVLQVEEFADDETLEAMGIEESFELSGLYEGIPLPEKSVSHSGTLPDRIRLFRRPILDEWSSNDYSLERLVRHIVVHEIGHHFGFSDQDMHVLEADAESDDE